MKAMLFSSLAHDFGAAQNPLYALRDGIVAKGESVIDLVRGNVTEHGINYPQDALQEILSEARRQAKNYCPDPRGQRVARQAIANNYLPPLAISPDQIVLTPGTSISYWYCFKLLAEPDDEILCPQPSYPLLDHIAALSGIRLRTYQLVESNEWVIDFNQLEEQITERTRAIVLISPHNPTGAVCSRQEIDNLAALAKRYGLAIIADEVFSEFLFSNPELPRPAETDAPLVFTLNGFSKGLALPGVKLGWIIVSGGQTEVERALDILETISDTFLPVSEITQFAVPGIIDGGKTFRLHYRRWVQECREIAVTELADLDFVAPTGGFYLTVGVKQNEDELSMQLLREQHILVHPGYFYGIDGDHFVMTFIHEQRELQNCCQRIREVLQMYRL